MSRPRVCVLWLLHVAFFIWVYPAYLARSQRKTMDASSTLLSNIIVENVTTGSGVNALALQEHLESYVRESVKRDLETEMAVRHVSSAVQHHEHRDDVGIHDSVQHLIGAVIHSKSFLEKQANSIDDWLSSNERRAGRKAAGDWLQVRNVSACEERVKDILMLNTSFDTTYPAEPHRMPDAVCKYYWDLQASKVCRPSGEYSFIYHWMGIVPKEQIDQYIESLRSYMKAYVIDSHIVPFSFLHMQSEDLEVRWRGSTLLKWATTNAISFKKAWGKWPLFICNSKKEADHMERSGIPCMLDQTEFFRGSYVNGRLRRLSRTVVMKYIYAYFIIEMGYTAFFFDTDSLWLRKMFVPAQGVYDWIGSVEDTNAIPARRKPIKFGFRPLRLIYKMPEFSWCGEHSDYIPLTSGIWVAYPTKWTFRFLSTYLDLTFVAWDLWWEQNLMSYMLPQFTAWGMKWANFNPQALTGGNYPALRTKHDCLAMVKTKAWVHTKFVAETYSECSKHIPIADINDKTRVDSLEPAITMNLLDDL